MRTLIFVFLLASLLAPYSMVISKRAASGAEKKTPKVNNEFVAKELHRAMLTDPYSSHWKVYSDDFNRLFPEEMDGNMLCAVNDDK